MTDPVIESSTNIDIRPFNAKLPKLNAKIKLSNLSPSINRFVHIYDFTPDKYPLPHFTVYQTDHGLSVETFGAEFGTPEIPEALLDMLEGRLKPTESSEAGPNKSHNIKTGAAAWNSAAPAPAAEPAKVPAVEPAPKPAAKAATAPAANTMLHRSDSDKYSDFSSDKNETPLSSVKNNDSDDEF